LAERPAKDTDLPVRFARLRFRQTDRSYLGVGIGDPRYELRPLADPHPEKDRLRRQPGMIIRHMGELPSGDVADCIDVSIGRAQPMVDLYALRIKFDTGLVEPESFHIGRSTGCDQQMAAFDDRL